MHIKNETDWLMLWKDMNWQKSVYQFVDTQADTQTDRQHTNTDTIMAA